MAGSQQHNPTQPSISIVNKGSAIWLHARIQLYSSFSLFLSLILVFFFSIPSFPSFCLSSPILLFGHKSNISPIQVSMCFGNGSVWKEGEWGKEKQRVLRLYLLLHFALIPIPIPISLSLSLSLTFNLCLIPVLPFFFFFGQPLVDNTTRVHQTPFLAQHTIGPYLAHNYFLSFLFF